MRRRTSIKLDEIQIIKSILGAHIGWPWPVALVKALVRKNTVFIKTRWADSGGSESEFVKRFSVASALYIELGKKIGRDKAFEVMEELLVSIGCREQWDHLKSMNVPERAGMERLVGRSV